MYVRENNIDKFLDSFSSGEVYTRDIIYLCGLVYLSLKYVWYYLDDLFIGLVYSWEKGSRMYHFI